MCQQCQATLRKGHILIFLVCFSVDVPELVVCALLERAGAGCVAEGSCRCAGRSARCWLARPVTPRRARCTVQERERVALQQRRRTVPERGLAKKPLSPVPRGSAWPRRRARFPPRTRLPGRGASGVPIYRLQLASSRGDFIVLPSSPTVCNPAFPHHTFLSLYHFLLMRILFITKNFLDWLLHFINCFNMKCRTAALRHTAL